MLAKARRNKADNSSTTSFAGTEASDESHGIRESADRALDKIKSIARGDGKDLDSPTVANIVKLMKGRRKKKERRRRADDVEDTEGPRGRSAGNGEATTSAEFGSEDLSMMADDDGSSLITDDSMEEE